MNMFHYISIFCLTVLARVNLTPAYNDHRDALEYLDTMDTDEMIEMLKELVGHRLREERAEEAADVYNQNEDSFPKEQVSLRKKRFFWNKERKEKANR